MGESERKGKEAGELKAFAPKFIAFSDILYRALIEAYILLRVKENYKNV